MMKLGIEGAVRAALPLARRTDTQRAKRYARDTFSIAKMQVIGNLLSEHFTSQVLNSNG